MRDAVIVSAVRTPVGKAPRGMLKNTRPDELGAVAVRAAVERVANLETREIDDVIMGCAMPEAEQGMNVARVLALRAGLPITVSAMTINRYCASGLQSIALASERIRCGGAEVIVAGGTESMSQVPMGGNKVTMNPWLAENFPGSYMTMGLTAERVAAQYSVSREDADQFAFESHRKAVQAMAAGDFQDELVSVPVRVAAPGDGKPVVTEVEFSADEGPRADTSLEALAKLKPAFHAKGVVTAGNSSQMSDGAAATVLMSEERAQAIGARPMARLLAYAYAGCEPELMGTGPIYAIPKVLKLAGLSLDQMEVIELNEAFATQSLAVIRTLGIDPARVNRSGGAIALGHPLGCTGAKLTATLLGEMKRSHARYGMVTMCVGGGMGAAGIFENLQD
ncbi:MAG: acetyl-CoA C-acyltransferase [Acidobacteriaceae bacterium]